MPDLNYQFDFGGMDQAGLSSLGAMAEVNTEVKALQTEMTSILGDGEKQGQFGDWVGKAPGQNDAGSGQLGHIFGQYQTNMGTEAQGLAALNKPFYDQKLWDDRGSPFKAFSIKSVESIGVSAISAVVACVPGVGPAVSIGISLANSAAWTTADIHNGVESWQDGWGNWAKGAAITAATSFVPSAGEMFKGSFGALGEVGQNMAMAGISAVQNKVISSTINSITYGSGGFGFNTNQFADNWNNLAAYADIASSMVSAGVTSGLGSITKTDGSGLDLNGALFNTKSIQSFDRLAGNLAGAGVTYGMTGQASLNVLNLADISGAFGLDFLRGSQLDANGNAIAGTMGTGEYVRSGLVELNIGNGGFSMNLGTGGSDVSVGSIANSWQGMVNTGRIAGAKLASAMGDQTGISKLNAINMLSSSSNAFNQNVASRAWNGELNVEFNKMTGKDAGALGYVDRSDRKSIYLSDSLEGNNRSTVAELAALLSHEGVHASGNDSERDAYGQSLGTYTELTSKYGLKADQDFLAANAIGYLNPELASQDSGGRDYWKLMKDGTLADDHKSSLSVETANGGSYQIWNMEGLTREESLAMILSGKKDQASVDNAKSITDQIDKGAKLFPSSVSEESKKRLGMFLITNAGANLSEAGFEQMAKSSFKMGDNLGYYIDFTQIQDQFKINVGGPQIGQSGWGIRTPDEMETMQKENVLKTSLQYGNISTLMGMGVQSSEVWNNREKPDGGKAETEDGNLASGYEQLARDYEKANASKNGVGKFIDGNGRTRFPVTSTPQLEFETQSGRAASAGGAALVQGLQFLAGASAGFNVDKLSLPIWNVGGTKFFTSYDQKFDHFANNGDGYDWVFSPQFLNGSNAQYSSQLKNFSTYLAMPDNLDKWLNKTQHQLFGW